MAEETNGKKEYGTTWLTATIIPLGGAWAFAVGIVRDSAGVEKLRIAKGKVNADADLDAGDAPVTQVQKFNIKKRDEWEKIKAAVDAALDELDPPAAA